MDQGSQHFGQQWQAPSCTTALGVSRHSGDLVGFFSPCLICKAVSLSELGQTKINKKPEADEEQSSPVTLPAARRHSGGRFSLSSLGVDPPLLHRTQKLVHVPLVLLKLALKFSWGPTKKTKQKQTRTENKKDKMAPSHEKHGLVKRGCGVRR